MGDKEIAVSGVNSLLAMTTCYQTSMEIDIRLCQLDDFNRE